MSLTLILAAAAVGASLPLLAWALASGGGPQQAVADNLARGLAAGGDLRQLALTESVGNRAFKPFLHRLSDLARALTPGGWLRSLERRLVLVGQPATWPLERLLATKMVLAVTGVAVGMLRVSADPGTFTVLQSMMLATSLFFVPDIVLMRKSRKRQDALRRKLPDTLDQMTICVEAGLGFEGAMARAARSGSGPVADEFRRTLQEMQIGATRGQALRSLQGRTEVPELRRFVIALTQADAYGLAIADVLRVQASELRLKRKQRAEEQAMKLPVKIVFPLVLCILPCLMIVVLGPAGMRIARFFGGGGL